MARRHAKANDASKGAGARLPSVRLPVPRMLLAAGWLVLFWERGLPVFWSLAGGIGLYAVLAWSGLVQALPPLPRSCE